MQNTIKLGLSVGLLTPILSLTATAAELPPVTSQENTNINLPNALPKQQEITRLQQQQTTTLTLSSTELEALKKDPAMFTRFLNDALAAGDLKTVKALLPIYQQLTTTDPMLIGYANAMLARANGKNKNAITIFRQMLAKDKDMPPVQLSLAQALFADKQYKEAKQQFLQLQSMPNLPPPITRIIQQYLTQIQSQSKAHFTFEIGSTRGHDLNDTAQKSINTLFGLNPVPPIDDKGRITGASVNEKINVYKNYYIGVDGSAQATNYHTYHQYNDANVTLAPKIGYANSLTDINLQPSFTKRWFGGDAYSDQSAISLNATHWLKPNLRLGTNVQYSHRHQDKDDTQLLGGNGLFTGINALYFISPQTYIITGINTYNHKTKTEDDAYGYRQNSLYFGVGNEWAKTLTTTLTVNDTKRKYHAVDTLFSTLNAQPLEKRQDNIYGVNFEAWKSDWKILGMTPKMTLSYNKTDSNYRWYERKGTTDVNFSMSKNF